jgi:hypothetical protein
MDFVAPNSSWGLLPALTPREAERGGSGRMSVQALARDFGAVRGFQSEAENRGRTMIRLASKWHVAKNLGRVLGLHDGVPAAQGMRLPRCRQAPASIDRFHSQPISGISTMRRFLGSKIQAAEVAQTLRKNRAKPRRFDARVDRLEGRNLMAGGSVVLTGGLVTITPSSTGPNVAIVSYQNVNGTMELDANLNGVNHDFGLGSVGFVYYEGSSVSGAQTFENETGLHTVAWGGSGANLFVSTTAEDEFFGGSGTNTFDAGSGVDFLVGGSGANVFNENILGSGQIIESGSSNTVSVPPGSTGTYYVD